MNVFSGKVDLKTSKTNKDKFERNQTDVFSLDADVGMLKKIRYEVVISYIYFCRKSWVFARYSGFLPQGMLERWVEISS